jgi:hypothetical protein
MYHIEFQNIDCYFYSRHVDFNRSTNLGWHTLNNHNPVDLAPNNLVRPKFVARTTMFSSFVWYRNLVQNIA